MILPYKERGVGLHQETKIEAKAKTQGKLGDKSDPKLIDTKQILPPYTFTLMREGLSCLFTSSPGIMTMMLAW